MSDMEQYAAKICRTAVGYLMHDGKVLLVHHRKLQIWLAPGGHIDEDELAHRAVEREFFEETGVRARVISLEPIIEGKESQYLPRPFLVNLHWVNKKSYEARLESVNPSERVQTEKFPRGCEQHVSYVYVMELDQEETTPVWNKKETKGVQWFGKEEVEAIQTTEDIKVELRMVFEWSGYR